jgi:anti-anti-sigma factor
MEPSALTIDIRSGPTGTRARVEGDIDISVATPVQEILLQAIRTHGPRLLLDLSGVSFLDCAGLRALVHTRRRLELHGGSLHLVAASASVHRILKLTGLQDIFPAFPVDFPASPASPAEARGVTR